MEQQELQKRLLLALVLSFFVFVGYSYMFPVQKPVTKDTVTTTKITTNTSAHQTPKVDTATPVVKNNTAPTKNKIPTLVTITSNHIAISIDNLGRMSQIELLDNKYNIEDGSHVKLLDIARVKPLEVRFSDTKINNEAFNTPYIYSGTKIVDVSDGVKSVVLTQKLSTLTITKTITFKSNGEYSVKLDTSKDVTYFITTGARPQADKSMYMIVRGVLVKGKDNIITTIEDEDATGYEKFLNAKIVSSFDRYSASLFYDFDKGLDVSIVKEENGDPLTFVQGKNHQLINGYVGAKENNILKAINPELTDAIEFGWFSFLSKPFFNVLLWINNIIGNWGWSIIIFTLMVKLILFPLSYKGMMSMQRLKDLAPKMKEIKEKYKDDPAKMNAQTMEMYKKHGANPLGGCLPMLLQIPIFFALYRVLLNADELQGADWILWIHNLAIMDPYFVLPVLMGISMWLQQKITPSNLTDPMQEKIFKFFPVIMTIFFVSFPSGLVLYWLVNNIFTIGQQYIINTMYAKQKNMAKESQKKSKDK